MKMAESEVVLVCLQSYEGLLYIFRPNCGEDLHNFAGIQIQAKQS